MNSNQFHNLERAVGTRFLEYVLNYKGDLSRHRQLEEYSFTAQQLCSADQLLSFLAMSYASTPGMALLNYPNLLPQFNQIRQLCGGALPSQTATQDPVLEYLSRRAVEWYPVLLLKEEESEIAMWGRSGFSRIAPSLAEATAVVALLSNDSDLRTLLRGDGKILTMRVEYALDNSLRVCSSPLSFCGDFLHGAFAACCYRGMYALPDFLSEVVSALEALRTIASGGRVQVSYFRGIYGLRLDPDVIHHLGNDTTLRNIGDTANPLTQGTVSTGTNEERSAILWGCVLEHSRTASTVPVDDSVQSWESSWAFFETLVDDLLMSIVLGGHHSRAPADKTFTDIYLPLYRHHPGLREEVRCAVSSLNEEDMESVREWFALLSAVDAEKVRIPLGRIRAALYERTSPVDSILDFFVAWESMFSTRVSTTSAVVRSMEAMLKRAGRPIPRKRLSDLYGLRSEIVHGSFDENTHFDLLTPEARESVRDEACNVALVVLAELLKDSELLQLEPEQRVWRLLNPTKEKCEHCKQSSLKFS